jgi:serine/threonine protein kinase
MGEVYCAKDTKLGRQVAIKVLPGHLAANPSARERLAVKRNLRLGEAWLRRFLAGGRIQ